jgi:methyl-accepting chemotaxis protein
MAQRQILDTKISTKNYRHNIIDYFLVSLRHSVLFRPLGRTRNAASRKQSLKDIVDVSYSLIEEYEKRIQKGEFGPEEGRKRAMERIKGLRYGQNDYIWINDTTQPCPVMIMHP